MTEAAARRVRDPRGRLARPRSADAQHVEKGLDVMSRRCRTFRLVAGARRSTRAARPRARGSAGPPSGSSPRGAVDLSPRPRRRLRRARSRDGRAPSGPAAVEIFQVNVGKLCNMTCRALPRRRGPRSRGRGDGPRDGRGLPRRPRPDRGAHGRPDGRRPGAEPELPFPRRRGGRARQARHRPLQPDGAARRRAARPPGVAGRARRRGRLLRSRTGAGGDGRAARRRGVREVARGAPAG